MRVQKEFLLSPKTTARELIGLRLNLRREGASDKHRDRVIAVARHWCERLDEMMQIMNGKHDLRRPRVKAASAGK